MENKELFHRLTEDEITVERDVISQTDIQKPVLNRMASKTNGDDNESAEDDDPRYY